MRQVAQQLTVGFGQTNLTLFTVDLQLLLDLGDLEHERDRIAELHRRCHTHRQRVTPDPAQFHDLVALAERVGLRIGHQLAHLGIVAEDAAGQLTQQCFARRIEQQLRCLIHMRDTPVSVDQHHRGRKQIKAVVKPGCVYLRAARPHSCAATNWVGQRSAVARAPTTAF